MRLWAKYHGNKLFWAIFGHFGAPRIFKILGKVTKSQAGVNKSSNSNTSVSYLDLNIRSVDSNLTFSLYDKRDDFSFDIVNFPFLDSCIPRKPALGLFFRTNDKDI